MAPPTEHTAPFRIDVRHHLAPPGFIKEIVAWNSGQSIDAMDKAGIAQSITPVSQLSV